MDLKARLRRLEKQVQGLEPEAARCRACGAPVPSIPGVIAFLSDGTPRALGILDSGVMPCPECGGIGGPSARRYDRDTGRVEGISVTICDRSQGHIERSEWLERFGACAHGAPWDQWLAATRGAGKQSRPSH